VPPGKSQDNQKHILCAFCSVLQIDLVADNSLSHDSTGYVGYWRAL